MAAAIPVRARPDACKRRGGAIRTVCRSPNHLHSATRSASTSRCFAASACTATPDGHQANRPDSPISCTAPSWRSGPLRPAPFMFVFAPPDDTQRPASSPGSPPPPRTRSGRLGRCSASACSGRPARAPATRAYTPASARGKRASGRPRRVLVQIARASVRPGSRAATASMDTSSQGFAAASDECSSGTASDRVPPGACSSSLAEILAITRRTLTIERASDGLGPTRRTDLFSPYGVRSSSESR